MGTVISNLKARFGVDTGDFKKGLKDGEKAVDDFKGAASDSVSQLADMFGVSMGAVGSTLQTVQRSLNFLGQSFGAAAKGGNILAISMRVLRVALISTGIGAIVVALGSLVAYFTKSGEGADRFAKILMTVKAAVNEVIDRLAIFGKGLFEIVTGKFRQGWETMSGAFKGMGAEIANNVREASALADAMDELEDREIALITVQGARRRAIAELREAAKDQDLTEQERIRKLDEVKKVIAAYYTNEIKLAEARYNQKKKEIDLAASDPTDEQRRELALVENEINELYAQRATELRGLSREYNALENSIAAALQAAKDETAKSMAAIQSLLNAEKGTKIFDIEGIKGQLAEVQGVVVDAMTQLEVALVDTVNGALNELAAGFGEFIGNLAIGETGVRGFTQMIAATFADMAITVGKIAIATGIATLGIKKALESLNPYVAIAAGIALIALGTIVRGALSKASSGGSASSSLGGSSSVSSGGVYDLRGMSQREVQPIKVHVTGKLTAEGRDLVYTIDKEVARKNTVS